MLQQTERELRKQEIYKEIFKQRPKLVLWQTRYCKPILTHEQLHPIMANLGFVPLPITRREQITAFEGREIPWIEYKYCGASANDRAGPLRRQPRPITINNNKPPPTPPPPPPNPRLPYQHIDGLHLYTYRAFLDAVNSYLGTPAGACTFHLQGIPANLDDMEVENWIYEEKFGMVVRRGTLDPNIVLIYCRDAIDFTNMQLLSAKEQEVSIYSDDPKIITMVLMDNIIVVTEQNNSSNTSDKVIEQKKNSSMSGEGGEEGKDSS